MKNLLRRTQNVSQKASIAGFQMISNPVATKALKLGVIATGTLLAVAGMGTIDTAQAVPPACASCGCASLISESYVQHPTKTEGYVTFSSEVGIQFA